MTIIAPKNNKNKLGLLIAGLIFAVIISAYWSISAYNQTVSLKHAISAASEQLQEMRAANAEMKNAFYQITDSKNLIKLGDERGMIKVEGTWSAASALR